MQIGRIEFTCAANEAEIERRVGAAIYRALRRCGDDLLSRYRANLPGSLKPYTASEVIMGTSRGTLRVGAPRDRSKGSRSFVVRLFDTGAKPHRILPSGRARRTKRGKGRGGPKALALAIGGGTVFAARVNHPGMAAPHALGRLEDETRTGLMSALYSELEREFYR